MPKIEEIKCADEIRMIVKLYKKLKKMLKKTCAIFSEILMRGWLKTDMFSIQHLTRHVFKRF
jgi:hypothetical protein